MFATLLRRLFCAAILLAPAAAAAQQQPAAAATPLPAPLPARPLANVVRFDALSALAPFFTRLQVVAARAGYERRLTDRLSGAVDLAASSYSDTRYYTLTLQGRYYAIQPKSKQALRGLYLAPHVSLLQLEEVRNYTPNVWSHGSGFGGQLGIQSSLGRRFIFDASTGLTAVKFPDQGPERPAAYGGVLPELQASFGYAF